MLVIKHHTAINLANVTDFNQYISSNGEYFQIVFHMNIMQPESGTSYAHQIQEEFNFKTKEDMQKGFNKIIESYKNKEYICDLSNKD